MLLLAGGKYEATRETSEDQVMALYLVDLVGDVAGELCTIWGSLEV